MAGDRSRSVLLAVLGALVVVALIYLAHSVAPGARPDQPATNETGRGPQPGGMFAPARAVEAGPAGAARAAGDDQAARPPPQQRVPLAELLDAVNEKVLAAAGACPVRPGHPDERVTLRYRVRVEQGSLSLADVTTLDSTLSDESLQDCMVEHALTIGWKVDTDDADTMVDQVLVLGGLMAARGMALPQPGEFPEPQPAPAPPPKRPADVPDWK